MRYLFLIFTTTGLLAAAMAFPGCDGIDHPVSPKPKGILAIVYSDLTKSINEQTADRQKRNIEDLFHNLSPDSKFYLFSIDRGTNKPSIYEYLPTFTEIKNAEDEYTVKEEMDKYGKQKESTESEKLKASLDSYHTFITSERGPVSCISNKLNSLADMIASKKASFPGYEVRLYFYSDMIEQCQNSFDGKPLTFEKYANESEETKHIQEIEKRIAENFEPASPNRNLKSMGARIFIVLTSQDDKQRLKTLKTLWDDFFGKLGLAPEDVVWTNGNEVYFWKLELVEPPKT